MSRTKKLKSIFRFLIYLVTISLFIENFFFESLKYGEENLLVIDNAKKFFFLTTFTFIFFYDISSILILLFNLPTSSIVEQKLNESLNYKKLSQALYAKVNLKDIYEILLETSISTSNAVAGWIEISHNKQPKQDLHIMNMSSKTVAALKDELKHVNFTENEYNILDLKQIKPSDFPIEYKSMLVFPLIFQDQYFGRIALIKTSSDNFNEEIIDIIDSYILQASISIKNHDLLIESIENERYQEEINIAKNVKSKLLKSDLQLNEKLEITVFSESSDLVGGDFYDSFEMEDGCFLLVISDVSGHGTSAAFNMAQLKGIFRTIVRTESNSASIPSNINEVLLECLEDQSFISMSFFFIDVHNQEITHYRCGHNPSLFKPKNKEVEILNPKGLGLGMVPSNQFEKLIAEEKINYSAGDILLCYTDGIIEAADSHQNQFGIESLINILASSKEESAQEIIEKIKRKLYSFTKGTKLKDDFTGIAIKFK